MRATSLIRSTPPSVVADGTGRFNLWIVFADGDPRLIYRHETLAQALHEQENEQFRRKGQTCCVFVTDRDNEERGQLSELDLEECGGDLQ